MLKTLAGLIRVTGVVMGFAATSTGTSSAILYDPDYNPKSGTYKGGYIKVPLKTFDRHSSTE